MATKLDSNQTSDSDWREDARNPAAAKQQAANARYGDKMFLPTSSPATKDTDDLAAQEEAAANDSAEPPAFRGSNRLLRDGEVAPPAPRPSLYTPAGGLSKVGQSFFRKHRKKIIAAGAGGGLLTVLMLLLIIAGAQLLPGFTTKMLSYGFATSARSFRQAQEQILSRKIANDAMSNANYIREQGRMSGIPKMSFLEQFRPKQVVANMITSGELDFEEKKSGVFGRTRITAIIINGERIPVTSPKLFQPIGNAAEKLRLSQAVDEALYRSMRFDKGVTGSLIRTRVGADILRRIGIRGLYAWANSGTEYKGKTPTEAVIKAQEDLYKKVGAKTGAPTSALSEVNKAAQHASEELNRAIVEEGQDAEELAKKGVLPKSVEAAIQTAEPQAGEISQIVSGASLIYSVAMPACMIFEASIQHSGPLIDKRLDALERTGIHYASAGQQQTSGETTPEAVMATNNQINRNGELGRSNAFRFFTDGTTYGTSQGEEFGRSFLTAESSGGDYTAFNLFLPEGAAEIVNIAPEAICPFITDWRTGVALGGSEIVLGFFSGGTYSAASKLGAKGVAVAFTKYFGQYLRKGVFNKVAMKRLLKQGAAIAGIGLYLRSLTEQHAGIDINGTTDQADQAFAGTIVMGQEASRSIGGIAQTKQQIIENAAVTRADMKSYQSQLSVRDRYFAVSNPDSLLSRLAWAASVHVRVSSIGQLLTSLSTIVNPHALASLFAPVFAPKALAAEAAAAGDPYQLVNFGFSQAEERVITANVTYWDIVENDRVLMKEHAKDFARIQETYGHCFTDTLGTLLSHLDLVRDEEGNIIPDQGQCAPYNLGLETIKRVNGRDVPVFASADAELVFRWRISMRADKVGESLNEIANPGTGVASDQVSTSGDSIALAKHLLENESKGYINLRDVARRDLQANADGKNVGTCNVGMLHPALLNILIKMSDSPDGANPPKYKLSINNFITGRLDDNGNQICNDGQHPFGRAADIQNINSSAVEDWDTCLKGGCGSGGGALATRFITDLAAIMPKGSRMGQIKCTDVKRATIPSYIQTFEDDCNHIHIDVRNVQ